jgi:hypothetical protein
VLVYWPKSASVWLNQTIKAIDLACCNQMSLRKSPRLHKKNAAFGNACEQESSAKKVKMNDNDDQKPAAADCDDAVSRQLLNGGKPLDLAVTAAIAAS